MLANEPPVHRAPHEGEGVVMDVDSAPALDWSTLQVPASSYALTVAQKKNIQTEEDETLSMTSTIECAYSEEEEYTNVTVTDEDSESEDDGEDQGDEDEDSEGEDDMTQMNSEDTIEETEGEDGMTDSTQMNNEDTMEETEEVGPIIDNYRGSDIPYCSDPPKYSDKNGWLALWNVADPRKQLTWIDVYAYYRKEKGDGGYGVILRNALAVPIIASAKYTADGKSFYYQVLLGIKAGITLAKKYEVSGSYVRCNSIKVKSLVDDAFFCPVLACRKSYGTKICTGCKNNLLFTRGCDMRLLPLVQHLKRYEKLHLVGYPKALHEAAHYLAKMGKSDHKLGFKKEGMAEESYEIKPVDFPQKLIDILWDDAMRGMSYYWRGPVSASFW